MQKVCTYVVLLGLSLILGACSDRDDDPDEAAEHSEQLESASPPIADLANEHTAHDAVTDDAQTVQTELEPAFHANAPDQIEEVDSVSRSELSGAQADVAESDDAVDLLDETECEPGLLTSLLASLEPEPAEREEIDLVIPESETTAAVAEELNRERLESLAPSKSTDEPSDVVADQLNQQTLATLEKQKAQEALNAKERQREQSLAKAATPTKDGASKKHSIEDAQQANLVAGLSKKLRLPETTPDVYDDLGEIWPDKPKTRPRYAGKEADEWDIREAVFRYQFANNEVAKSAQIKYYFLFLGADGDPPADFIKRFSGHRPRVEPASMAGASSTMSVIHKRDLAYGLIFKAKKINWINDNTVELDGGYYQAQTSTSGNTYRVERRGGRWQVAERKKRWTSLGQL